MAGFFGDEIVQHRSPDGRLLLEIVHDFDPRDIHEIDEQIRPHVRDGATGATLVNLHAINSDSRFEWTADGGLLLVMANGLQISIAADGGSWWINDDVGTRQPIATAQDELTALLTPPVRRDWRHLRQRAETAAAVLFGLLLLAVVGWQYSRGELKLRNQLYTAPKSLSQPVDAWMLHCSAPLGMVAMHLGADGRLVVPPSVASGPLAALGEGRFGDGAATVTIDGTRVTILPVGAVGGRALPCASASPAATIGTAEIR